MRIAPVCGVPCASAECLAAFCLTSQANRDMALDRDTIDVLLCNMRAHMGVAEVGTGCPVVRVLGAWAALGCH
jgi:hypothetical protein